MVAAILAVGLHTGRCGGRYLDKLRMETKEDEFVLLDFHFSEDPFCAQNRNVNQTNA